MDNAYIYTRVSTILQVDGYSLDAQEEEIRAFAKQRNINIVGKYSDEGKSGKNAEHRPAFNQMMEDIRSRKDNVKYVLVFKLSRFARNTSDTAKYLQELASYSNVLIAATDGGGAMDFRPSLSMENGHLQEIAGVYDFSTYEEEPDERSIQIATELLLETDEVKQAVMQGMKVMYTGDTQWIEGRPCLLFALGTDSEDQFVRERYYGVCDNLVYSYDAISDTWSTVGRQ